jgi:hypothetical protein
MFSDLNLETTDTDDENPSIVESQRHDLSLSSVKTQDSYEKNSNRFDPELEENKEGGLYPNELRKDPYISLTEAHHLIFLSLNSQRMRLCIKNLRKISKNLHSLSEKFQMWKKQD